MGKRIAQLFLMLGLGIISLAKADFVVLENGDRLTGTIVKSDQETLSFDSYRSGRQTRTGCSDPWETLPCVGCEEVGIADV